MRRHRRLIAVPPPQPARPIAGERLDLDDLGPVHRQEHGAIRAGHPLAQIQDAQASIGILTDHFSSSSLFDCFPEHCRAQVGHVLSSPKSVSALSGEDRFAAG
jgi:hypothetical protein